MDGFTKRNRRIAQPLGRAAPVVFVPAAPPQPGVLTARLYPLNAQANTGGLLTAVAVDNHTDCGAFTLACLGDTPQGEATRVDANCAAFGGIHRHWALPREASPAGAALPTRSAPKA